MSAPALACETAAVGQPFQGLVVIHLAVDDFAAMAVAGVFAIAHVGHDQQPGNRGADRADGALHDPIVGVCPRSNFVLGFRQAEKYHAAYAERVNFGAFLNNFVDRHLIIAGHGADFAAKTLARAGKEGQNEFRRVEAGFAHQAAHRFAGAQPAHAVYGERHFP